MPRKMLNEFDPSRDFEDSPRPPASWYSDEEFFEQERYNIFEKFWIPVARKDQLSEVGSFVSGDLLGNPWIILNTGDGFKGYHNVCRHMGHSVAEGEGKLKSCLTCPYHGWEYNFNGDVKSVPKLGKKQNFRKQDFGLKPIAVDTWGPFVFIDMDGPFGGQNNPRSLAGDVAPLQEHLNFDGYKFFERREYHMKCNWKAFVENSLDGGYHVAYIHENLSSGLEFEGYETHVWDRSSIQICDTNSSDDRLGEKVMYAYIYPNFFINQYGNVIDTNTIIPINANECKVVFDFYFNYPDFDDWATKKIMEKSVSDSHAVQLEDVDCCENVQKGMKSMSFRHGQYASLEKAVHEFHVRLHRDMKGHID